LVWRGQFGLRCLAGPGGVYLDIPGALLGQVMDQVEGAKSLVKVIDPAPAQTPGATCGCPSA